MNIPTQYEIAKALVSMAIEYTLLDYGKEVYDKFIKRLNDNDFTIHDCFDHPDYLNKILNEQFGSSYARIIHSFHVWLGDSLSNQLISDFFNTVKSSSMEIYQNKK